MARPHKMWWWEQRGEFAVDFRGKRHRLGPDRDAAILKFHALLATPPDEPVKVERGSVLEVMDTYLSEATFKSEATKGWYQKYLQSFTDFLKEQGDTDLSVSEFTPLHVLRWLKTHPGWGDTTKNNACRAIQTTFRWANRAGVIRVNPVAFIPGKPAPDSRENVISEQEYQTIVKLIRDDEFRELIEIAWTCGPRPQEILRVEKRNVDEQHRRWVFGKKEGKKLKKPRIRYVYLTDRAMEITRRQMLKHPEGPIFRNRAGKSWTPYSVNCRFVRIAQKIGRKFALVDFRHSFVERLRMKGVNSLDISALMGHADLSMVGRTYAHPHVAPDHLLKILNESQ